MLISGPNADKTSKPGVRRNTLPSQHRRQSPISGPRSSSPPATKPGGGPDPASKNGVTTRTLPADRPVTPRNGGPEKTAANGSPSPQRRGSWFSNISSKFSSGPAQSPPQATTAPPKPAEAPVPKISPAKNAVLQHAARYDGEGPYTPAPPKSSQTGILQVFRRLSSSSGQMGSGVKGTHGLVERKILNVDQHRERCKLPDLDAAKLRRVSFWVDVEIAPMPRYADQHSSKKSIDGTQSKAGGRAEADAPKEDPKDAPKEAPKDAPRDAPGDAPKDAPEDAVEDAPGDSPASGERTEDGAHAAEAPTADGENSAAGADGKDATSDKPKDSAKKKKKEKRKHEEEKKAKKEEKKRMIEVANGSKPMEIQADGASSGASTPTDGHPRAQLTPTTNPVRIYRRCCQLRETPILKKITEQLTNAANFSAEHGTVEKIDLTGYWLQLPDLVTLGDYLAVVPVRELLLENCGLTDEGLRVVLAGLLAAKMPARKTGRPADGPDGLVKQGGVVERLVIKNNKIGTEGWRHVCLFIYMCRSLKVLDLSALAFPREHVGQPQEQVRDDGPPPTTTTQLLARSVGERLGGSTLELLNLGETGLNTDDLGVLVDGFIRCGIRRLGLANNAIDEKGAAHVARYLRSGKCEGLDLGGNEVGDQLDQLAEAISEDHPLWALSLADCGLKPAALCKLMLKLTRLADFRFIDLSHNHDLFGSEPSATSMLRKYVKP
jgi:hypothetical protein